MMWCQTTLPKGRGANAPGSSWYSPSWKRLFCQAGRKCTEALHLKGRGQIEGLGRGERWVMGRVSRCPSELDSWDEGRGGCLGGRKVKELKREPVWSTMSGRMHTTCHGHTSSSTELTCLSLCFSICFKWSEQSQFTLHKWPSAVECLQALVSLTGFIKTDLGLKWQGVTIVNFGVELCLICVWNFVQKVFHF